MNFTVILPWHWTCLKHWFSLKLQCNKHHEEAGEHWSRLNVEKKVMKTSVPPNVTNNWPLDNWPQFGLTWPPPLYRIRYCLGIQTTRDRRLRPKPALVQDTDYMVEKTYQLAPYLGAIEAYLMMFPYNRWNVAVNSPLQFSATGPITWNGSQKTTNMVP